VTGASYAARRYGIRSALPISRAWRLAETARRKGEPEVIFVRGDRALYLQVSSRIMAIVGQGLDAFEEASIDEAYVDLSSLGDLERAQDHARMLKQEILEREGLTCSVGIGPNKLVAKIASDLRKPDGLTVARPEEERVPGWPPDPGDPGIGPKTEGFLHEKRIKTVAQLAARRRSSGSGSGRAATIPPEGARLGRSRIERVGSASRWGAGDVRGGHLDPRLRLGRAQELAPPHRVFVAERLRLPHRDRHRAFRIHDREPVENRQDPVHRRAQPQAEVRRLLEPFFDARRTGRGRRSASSGCGWRSSCAAMSASSAPPAVPSGRSRPSRFPETRPLEGTVAPTWWWSAPATPPVGGAALAERGADVVVLDAAEPGWGAWDGTAARSSPVTIRTSWSAFG
jgi:hypothetical protein